MRTYHDIGVGNPDSSEPAVTAGGRRHRMPHGESQRPLRYERTGGTRFARLSELAPFEPLTWLCAFALGLTVAHLVSFGSAIPMYIMIAVWLGAISLRIAAEARS
ncbi:MAG: hypothetical protein KJZ65_06570 [Phycisphaerales bacterium]|nr:hypothetical protein [Phycisphaerales bacterium]